MSGLPALRQRLPLIVFLLLVVLLLMLVGFACACLANQPMHVAERALTALTALPAVLEVWSPLIAGFLAASLLLAGAAATYRASPALLQRFLF